MIRARRAAFEAILNRLRSTAGAARAVGHDGLVAEDDVPMLSDAC